MSIWEWQPIEKEPKRVKKGFMRLYTFRPEVTSGREYLKLHRAYQFSKSMGYRKCDGFIDIPLFTEGPKP